MNPQLALVLGLLGGCIAMFIANRPRMDVVALLAMIALPLAGIITVPEAMAGFSDPNVILIAALFIVGESLVRTGVANHIGDLLLKHSAGSETKLLILLMLAVAGLGSLMSSTGVVAIFIPVVLLVASRRKLAPGRLMMPLAYAGLISGMLTLVGTAPNLVVDSALRHAGHAGFGFFSFTPFGAVILAIGIGYLLIARRWLDRPDEGRGIENPRRQMMDFVQDYRLAEREYRMRIGKGSPLIDQTLESAGKSRRSEGNVVAIERKHGNRVDLMEPRAGLQLLEGDVLLIDIATPPDEARSKELDELKLEPLHLRGRYFTDRSREIGMAEVLIPPDSKLVGRTIVEATFRTRLRLNVIGLRRGREAVDGVVAEEKLRAGDTLLVIGRWKHIMNLQKHPHDFVVLTLPTEMDEVAPAASKAPWALACLAVMVLLMVTGWVPNVIAALLTCLLLGATRCINLDSAYRAVQWPSLILIVGMIPFSTALQKTGGVDLAVNGLLQIFGDAEPRLLLAALFALTSIIGMFVSNTATAVLMAPIALSAAQVLGVSPHPFAMTVALASSAAFMTPVSSPVNTLVMVPGKYRFGDFVKIGVPFTLLVMILTVLLVPWLLPL
ncbi:SLC13 family permease [Luteolibacter flavescens]|uniref:SLC13 family permease n=1 Tax=Luteolibacter flavescens TaxID=1859460 RepID=A0ABT3FQH1_9BACT|nr:SLC13 family permease [Luteolibacter flavescens]MCW1885812.1 SLC13 family permease [Luteolibacter flavescens]